MDFKMISIILIVAIIIVAAAFVVMEYGESLFGSSSDNGVDVSKEIDSTFGTPPEGFEPPVAPTT